MSGRRRSVHGEAYVVGRFICFFVGLLCLVVSFYITFLASIDPPCFEPAAEIAPNRSATCLQAAQVRAQAGTSTAIAGLAWMAGGIAFSVGEVAAERRKEAIHARIAAA